MWFFILSFSALSIKCCNDLFLLMFYVMRFRCYSKFFLNDRLMFLFSCFYLNAIQMNSLNFSMMNRTNRRFPFERVTNEIVVDHVTSSCSQLYPMLRDYFPASRTSLLNDQKSVERRQTPISIDLDDSKREQNFREFLERLKTNVDQSDSNIDDISTLRETHRKRWKFVKQQWLKYYHDQRKEDQNQMNHLMKMS